MSEENEAMSQADAGREASNWSVTNAPYGYGRIQVEENGQKRFTLELDPPRDAVVRRIFRMILEGRGIPEVTDILNNEGIPNTNGQSWIKSSIYKILGNETYVGTMVWGRNRRDGREPERVENAFPAIISKDEFQEARRILGSRTSPRTRSENKPIAPTAESEEPGASPEEISQETSEMTTQETIIPGNALANLLDDLQKPVPPELISVRPGPYHQPIPYLRWQDTALILDQICARHGARWNSELTHSTIQERQAVVRCRLTLVSSDGDEVYREAVGTFDLDSSFTGPPMAVADRSAFKRAAGLFGLGNDLQLPEGAQPNWTRTMNPDWENEGSPSGCYQPEPTVPPHTHQEPACHPPQRQPVTHVQVYQPPTRPARRKPVQPKIQRPDVCTCAASQMEGFRLCINCYFTGLPF